MLWICGKVYEVNAMLPNEDRAGDGAVNAFFREATERLVPMVEASALVCAVVSGDAEGAMNVDAKLAVEVGVALLVGKPIVLVAHPRIKIPPRLREAVDRVVIVDPDSEGAMDVLQAAFEDVVAKNFDRIAAQAAVRKAAAELN